MQRLINEGSDVNEEDENGWTPMQIACQKGNVEIVKILRQHKARIIRVNSQQRWAASYSAPLHIAIFEGHLEIVKILCESKMSVNDETVCGNTALHLAVEKGSVEITKLLISSGAYLDLKNDKGMTPLMKAVEMKHLEIAKLLISHCKNFSTLLIDPLKMSVETKQFEIVKCLIENGAPENIFDLSKDTILHMENDKFDTLLHMVILDGEEQNPVCTEIITLLTDKNPSIINTRRKKII